MSSCDAPTPRDPVTLRGAVRAWLPPGTWFDAGTGRRYRAGEHGRTLAAYRDLAHTVVLAPAGTVLPLTAEDEVANGVALPRSLEVRVHAGGDGEHVLVEDDYSDTQLAELFLEHSKTVPFNERAQQVDPVCRLNFGSQFGTQARFMGRVRQKRCVR